MPRGRFSTSLMESRRVHRGTAPAVDDRRSEILEAAATVICRDGFDRTRTARIAEEAGVSGGTLIYHFGTLDRLLVSALQHAEKRFYEAAEEIVSRGETAEERLEDLVRWVFTPDGGNSQLWALWLETWSQAARHPEVAEARAEQDERWRSMIRGIVRETARDEREASEFAVRFGAIIDGLTIQVALGDPELDAAAACSTAMTFARAALRWPSEPSDPPKMT